MKKCPKCGRILSKKDFAPTARLCKTCSRDYAWQYNYGISPEQYFELWQVQKGECKICGKKLPEGQYLCVDHNKETGEVRGLLCKECNWGLGNFHDNPESLEKAIEYLKENE